MNTLLEILIYIIIWAVLFGICTLLLWFAWNRVLARVITGFRKITFLEAFILLIVQQLLWCPSIVIYYVTHIHVK